ncbi:MAG: DUF4168 domain-containing protein [Oscillatoriales cyanobacterium SM2_3_0]|nr:DUF4168 domain-containing protein [Oscillatoriales cyanobacterium SM2_3_0]
MEPETIVNHWRRPGFIWMAIAGLLPDNIMLSANPVLDTIVDPMITRASAQAQSTFSDQEIASYARSVLDIEQRRKQAYQEIKALGGNPGDIFCGNPQQINRLKRDIRQVAVNYCNQAKASIESNALTVTRFNQITESLQANPANPDLQKRVQAELSRLQSSSI